MENFFYFFPGSREFACEEHASPRRRGIEAHARTLGACANRSGHSRARNSSRVNEPRRFRCAEPNRAPDRPNDTPCNLETRNAAEWSERSRSTTAIRDDFFHFFFLFFLFVRSLSSVLEIGWVLLVHSELLIVWRQGGDRVTWNTWKILIFFI